jgi:hypothetical protein
MHRTTRTNLLLLGVLAVLGTAIFMQVNREIAQFEPPLSRLDPASVRMIRVECLYCVARRFERVGEHWQMREPYDLPANDAQVERLLAIANSAVRSRRPLGDLDAGKIGLDPPLMRLQLDGLHLDFGTNDALDGDRYVRVGDSIAMVPDRFSPFLAAAPASELDSRLVPRDAEGLRLRVNGIERPDLIAAWSTAHAARVVAAEGKSPPGASDRVAELAFANLEPIRYRLVREGDVLVVRREDPPLDHVIDEAQARSLFGDPERSAR